MTASFFLLIGSLLLGVGLLVAILVLQQQKKRLQLQMESLRANINPHFMSNSLNAIEGLINTGQNEEASKYLIHFSRLSRRILNSSRTPYTSLSEEIKTVKHFLALEQLRFRDKLSYSIEVQAGIKAKLIQVPALILQPYLENAIWHGIKPKTGTGHLRVLIEKVGNQLVCMVEDDGIGRKKSKELQAASMMKHKSQGRQISQERLRLNNRQKGTKVEIEDLEDEFGKPSGTRVVIRLNDKLLKK